MAPTLPSLHWRDLVRRSFWRYRESEPEPSASEFLSFVEASYAEAKAEQAKASDADRTGVSLVLYILSVALLTYGRLDVVADLLTHTPPERARARSLLRAVDALMPAEAQLDAFHDPSAALTWIEQHRHELAWREELGRFELAPQDARASDT